MDDLTIHIDELVLDGSGPVDEDAVAAAIGGRAGETVDDPIVSEASRAVARSLSSVRSPLGPERC
jgi:hypothetical protein